jgi:hypothetical protein
MNPLERLKELSMAKMAARTPLEIAAADLALLLHSKEQADEAVRVATAAAQSTPSATNDEFLLSMTSLRVGLEARIFIAESVYRAAGGKL